MLTASEMARCFIAGTFTLGICQVLIARRETVGAKRVAAKLLLSFALLFLAVLVAAFQSRGQNAAVDFVSHIFSPRRVDLVSLTTSALCGVVAAIALSSGCGRRPLVASLLVVWIALGLSLLILRDSVSTLLANPTATGGSGLAIQRSVVPGFVIEKFASCPNAPTSITVDGDGALYVAGYSGTALQNGNIVKITPVAGAAAPHLREVANGLTRPHGIAIFDGHLYVSRAGQYSRAISGRIVQQDTGAVTRLRDLDGDGTFDDYEDVIHGLPGAQLPDGLHQNNGLTFDNEGNVYITVGAPTDAQPFSHPLAGTILTATAEGTELRVFARGLRNPYGITFGPGKALFCTDNDPNSDNKGDELNHLREGRHYGFPYDSTLGSQVIGSTEPITRFTSAQGITYAPKGALPDGFDDCLYVASYADGNINRVRLIPSGDTYECEVTFFAHVPSVVSVAVSKGIIYACSHHDREIFRITPLSSR